MSLKRAAHSSYEDEVSSPSASAEHLPLSSRPKHLSDASEPFSGTSAVRIIFLSTSLFVHTFFLTSQHAIPYTQQNNDAFALMMASSRTLHKQEVEQERFLSVLRSMNLVHDDPASGPQGQKFCAFCRANGRTSVPAIGTCAFCEKPCCGTGCSRVCQDCGNLFCLTCSVTEFVSALPLQLHNRFC